MVADGENSETLKGLPKFDGKDPEQSRPEISIWLMQRGRGHLGLLKPPATPPRNAGAEAIEEYQRAVGKWEIRNDIAYDATYSLAKYDASAKEVADTYHKECVDGDPPREPRVMS